MDKCAICGGGLKVIKDKPYNFIESGLTVILLGIPHYVCESCDEEFVSIPNPEQLHKMIAMDICKNKKALLLPEEIRFLRKELYLKAKDLARSLGVDSATLSRWETGKRPIGEGYDRLLRAFYLSCAEDVCQGEDRCHNLIEVFTNLPVKRKVITTPHILSLNPQEWLKSSVACSC
jgi:putative zinc finger/helix-turn-helix YgiT family protein